MIVFPVRYPHELISEHCNSSDVFYVLSTLPDLRMQTSIRSVLVLENSRTVSEMAS